MHQQLIMNIIDLFTPQSKVDFYAKIFDTLDLSVFPDEANSSLSGPDGFSRLSLSLIRIANLASELPAIPTTRKTMNSTGAIRTISFWMPYLVCLLLKLLLLPMSATVKLPSPYSRILISAFLLMKHTSSLTKAMTSEIFTTSSTMIFMDTASFL